MPPHAPYRPSRDFASRFNDGWAPPPKKEHRLAAGTPERKLVRQRQLYDEFIANLDDDFGALLDYLDSSGLSQNSYIVVTSDHGEMFERGEVGHSTLLLFEPVIRVPLLIAAPGQQTRQDVHDLTSNVDMLPTLLKIAGLPIPAWCEGQLLPGMGGQADPQRSIYSMDAKRNPAHSPLKKASLALFRWPYKLVRYMGYRNSPDTYELYDLQNDPGETYNQYSDNPLAKEMQAELESKLAEVDAPYTSAK
jgi:arylsulfatase A-like enzyme